MTEAPQFPLQLEQLYRMTGIEPYRDFGPNPDPGIVKCLWLDHYTQSMIDQNHLLPQGSTGLELRSLHNTALPTFPRILFTHLQEIDLPNFRTDLSFGSVLTCATSLDELQIVASQLGRPVLNDVVITFGKTKRLALFSTLEQDSGLFVVNRREGVSYLQRPDNWLSRPEEIEIDFENRDMLAGLWPALVVMYDQTGQHPLRKAGMANLLNATMTDSEKRLQRIADWQRALTLEAWKYLAQNT